MARERERERERERREEKRRERLCVYVYVSSILSTPKPCMNHIEWCSCSLALIIRVIRLLLILSFLPFAFSPSIPLVSCALYSLFNPPTASWKPLCPLSGTSTPPTRTVELSWAATTATAWVEYESYTPNLAFANINCILSQMQSQEEKREREKEREKWETEQAFYSPVSLQWSSLVNRDPWVLQRRWTFTVLQLTLLQSSPLRTKEDSWMLLPSTTPAVRG